MINDDLKIIKKKYGEKMMHLCRELFSTILDNHPGVLSQLLLESFAPNHYLYDDLIKYNYENSFRNYIYSIYEKLRCRKEDSKLVVEDPFKLMKKAGYTLYECTTEEAIQKFRKYYAKGETLCTFNGGRLNRCYVYFAVRENALELDREKFFNPERQDEYGTSVISIQFTRDKSYTLSIKNRYNHTVSNPDATFSNNLDNIIPGLTESFANYYGMKQRYSNRNNFEMIGYVQASDGRFYKYNYEINNVYYCPNNIIIDNYQVREYSHELYLIMDYFILDLVNKKISIYNTLVLESFPETIGKIKNINIKNESYGKTVIITPYDGEDIVISLDKFNRIIKLINNNLVNVPDLFLMFNKVLEDISLKKAKLLGSFFLSYNSSLLEIELPKVKKIGEKFMAHSNLESVFLPQVTVIGNGFLAFNYAITNVSLPEAITIGNDFIRFNSRIKSVNLPKLKKLGCNALNSISLFAKFYAPCLCDWRFGNERIRMLAYKGQAIVNDSRKKYVLKIK